MGLMVMFFARIAQMESSRFVGGRAQTQALLRAPIIHQFSSPSGEPDGRRHAIQPPAEAAAVNIRSSRSMRSTSGAVSTTAADAITPRGVAAFSSELADHPTRVCARQAVDACGSASASTANQFAGFAGVRSSGRPAIRRNQSALRVAAASVIAEKSNFISASGA